MEPTDDPDHRILYLSRGDIREVGGGSARPYVEALTEALRLHATEDFAQPLKPYLRWRDDGHIADRIIAMPAYVGGSQPTAGLKWIGSKHDNPSRLDLERASALIVLNDPETHYPIAVLEGGLISAMRTAAVTAVAARYLARRDAGSVACFGCGPIGRLQVRTLLEELPGLEEVHLFDLDRAAAETFAAGLDDVAVRVHQGPEPAVAAADVVVTATVADEPWLPWSWLRPGTFVSNVSIMDVHEEVFVNAGKVVVDDWDQCNREGKVIHRLVEAGRFSREDVHAELGEIVAGLRPGREQAEEVILLNPMGMAIEDVACARAVFDRALHEGLGTWLPLG